VALTKRFLRIFSTRAATRFTIFITLTRIKSVSIIIERSIYFSKSTFFIGLKLLV